MNYKNQGLTVGELTIAVGVVIIIALTWSNLGNKENSKTSVSYLQPSTLLLTKSS